MCICILLMVPLGCTLSCSSCSALSHLIRCEAGLTTFCVFTAATTQAREAKQSALDAQKHLVSRLRTRLQKVMAQLEGKDEPPSAPSTTGGSGSHLSVAEQRRLLTEAKRIQNDLEQALTLEKNLTAKRPKPTSESDRNVFGSTAVSAAALQALPEPLAAERRKQIAEVNSSHHHFTL